MENPKISETTREKLEDAAISVVMEQYAKALNAGINKKMEDCAEEDFPVELDKRCRTLIQQEFRKSQNKKRREGALRVLRSAAVVAVVMLSLCSVLFVTVDAFRLPIMNFFIEKTDRFWQLSSKPTENVTPEAFNPENPLAGIIPNEFVLNDLAGSWEDGCFSADYSNGKNAVIYFSVSPAIGNIQFDTEDAFVNEEKLGDHNVRIAIENDIVRIIWLDPNTAKTFALCATNISPEVVKNFAEALIMQLQ